MKWKRASCSSRGNLSPDVELLRHPATFRSKVVVRELLHLDVPKHGKPFRALDEWESLHIQLSLPHSR